MDRAAFLAERLTGIGGSDIHHLFSLEPYGCALKLWREKRGDPPDYPVVESGPMRRGNKMEPLIADEYAEATGRRLEARPLARHPEHRWAIVHVDRVIHCDCRPDPGVLEVKSVGREMFSRVKRDGMPDAYILQAQHGMWVTGCQWGAFAVHCADNWQLLHWDVERDDDMIGMIQSAGEGMWRSVLAGDAPERLDPGDKRCQRCEYRTSCQGRAMLDLCKDDGSEVQVDPRLEEVVSEYLEAHGIVEEAEALLAGVREKLEAAIGDRTAVECRGGRVYWRPQTSMRMDAKELAKSYDRLVAAYKAAGAELIRVSISHQIEVAVPTFDPPTADKFKKASVSRPLRVFPL